MLSDMVAERIIREARTIDLAKYLFVLDVRCFGKDV